MSLTSISTVRKHLYRLNLGQSEIRNFAIRLVSDNHVSLPHSHIVTSSEAIKAIESSVPTQENITLNDDPVSLSNQMVAAGTVVCANDSSLTTVYQENIDFSIDYLNGTVRRIEGGSISSGSTVSIWYLFYHAYQKNIDYTIDYTRGHVNRLASGSIEDGQELLIDYQLGATEFSDEEVNQCILEAEAEIGLLIDDSFKESVDPALQTAATYLSLSLLCRNSIGFAQAGASSSTKDARLWLELSASYRETAMRLLNWFRPESPLLHTPKLT
ncbi:MAG: hypothetical protein V3V99_09440 [candidate division Zixibacteria bacterium]